MASLRPGTGSPVPVVPLVVVAPAASAIPTVTSGVTCLGVGLAPKVVAKAGALRRPRGPFRPAAATSVVPATTMAPALLPILRRVAPARLALVPTTSPSATATATVARVVAVGATRAGHAVRPSAARVATVLAGLPRPPWRRGLAVLAARPSVAVVAVLAETVVRVDTEAASLAPETTPILAAAIATGVVPVGKTRPLAS